MSLATLPPELYSAILSHVSISHLQSSTLDLSRAIPLSPVPLYLLFENITISHQQQLPQLYRRLKHPRQSFRYFEQGPSGEESTWVRSFSLVTWQVDVDILVNVLTILPHLQHLSLRIGPVFSPDHLENIMEKSTLSLSTLKLRFRPYVQVATYYQFLKGSYFDSTMELISRWSSSSALTRLSIIQDPLPPPPVEKHMKAFAQPIVFFSLAPLVSLSVSPGVQRVTHVRLRIPSRQLVRFITVPSPPGNPKYAFPRATLLDISSSTVREMCELEILLNHVGCGQLQHLLLDNTLLCNGNDGEWEALGRTCALAGVKRSRDREKVLKAWMEAGALANNEGQDHDVANPEVAQDRRPRRGRRGLATATISLRDHPPDVVPASLTPAIVPQSNRPRKVTKLRVLPPPPRLLSLSISLPRPFGNHTAEGRGERETRAYADFSKGWSEGLEQLRSIWARLRQSQSNGITVVRFDTQGSTEAIEGVGMLAGLAHMSRPGDDQYWETLQDIAPPILCFAGARGEENETNSADEWPDHPSGCGHRIAWEVWDDNL